jgi:aspartate carbamoyltransferase catalytic subunit
MERKHVIELSTMSEETLRLILDTADSFRNIADRPVKKVPTLRGRTVVNLFMELLI